MRVSDICHVHRIIPARAGFTRQLWGTLRAHQDHPRSRGVYRGRMVLAVVMLRIIPARAGFTFLHSPCRGWVWDHPRSRGVYDGRSPIFSRRLGSSPLARGLRCFSVWTDLPMGIIPARAGFTPNSEFVKAGDGDHPRSRGVYVRLSRQCDTTPGSSPLARGLLVACSQDQRLTRIIPARAGFT